MPSNLTPHLVSPGDTFGRLTVIGFSHNDRRHRRHYVVTCSCGAKKTVQGTLLRSGNTMSCGCFGRDRKRAQRLPNDAGVIRQIVLGIERHARDRELAFELAQDDVSRIVRLPCAYCGDPAGNIKRTKSHEGFRYNGVDRVDSELGYVASNCVACCWRCNAAKGDMTLREFHAWVLRLAAMADQWGALLPDAVEIQ